MYIHMYYLVIHVNTNNPEYLHVTIMIIIIMNNNNNNNNNGTVIPCKLYY